MRTLALATFAALLPAAAAPQASAPPPARPGVLAVLPVAEPPGPSRDLADLAAALRSAVVLREPLTLTPAEVRRRIGGEESAATLTELDRAYRGAVAASQAGDWAGAALTLRAVVADLDRVAEGPDAAELRARALLRLARVQGMAGAGAEARETLERLLRADPAARADPELYPPSFVQQVDAARAALRQRPQRTLRVTAGGRPARIFVEGRDVGVAPVAVPLRAGTYRVTAALGERRVRTAAPVDLSDGDQTLALDLSVAETLLAEPPGVALEPARRDAGAVAAGAALRLERLVAVSTVAAADTPYLVASLYDVRRGALLREGRLRLAAGRPADGALAALAAYLVDAAPSPLVLTGADLAVRAPPPLAPPPPAPRRGRSRALGWTALGAGALAVGLGAFAGYEAAAFSRATSRANGMLAGGTLRPGADPAAYDRAVDDAASARRAAWISGGGAAACLATAGVLGYLSWRQTGEIGPFRF